MSKLITVIILCLGYVNLFSQDFKTIENDKICDENQAYNYVEPVDSFKNEVILTIEINEFSVGRDTEKIDKTWTGNIANETPIIKVNKEGAIRVSIGKVIDNGRKYYIYRIHLYKKINGCWEDQSSSVNWSRCKLGEITNGHGIGNKGTSDYVGFSGKISIE